MKARGKQMNIDMVSIDRARNRYRFYSIGVCMTLFGVELLIKWGRIGSYTRTRTLPVDTLEEATQELRRLLQRRLAHRYVITDHNLQDDFFELPEELKLEGIFAA